MTSTEQRRQALDHANVIRRARARLRDALKTGEVSSSDLARLVCAPPDYLATMRALDLVDRLPLVGPVAARKMLTKAGVSTEARIGKLTDRQRAALAQQLVERSQRLVAA